MDELLENNPNTKNQSNKNRKNNKNKKKINRGNKKRKESELCIVSANAAQLKGKLCSFKSVLKQSNAGLFTVQESHYATKGKVQVEEF